MYDSMAVTAYYKEEIKQAYTRIIFLALIIIFCFYQYMIANPLLIVHSKQVEILLYLAVGVTLFHTLFINFYAQTLVFLRRQFIMVIDFTAITLILYSFEEQGIYFSPIYLWIVIGNGMRYGTRYFFAGISISLFALAMLIHFSEYWSMHINVIIALAIAVFILPLFYLKLLNRLNEKNEVLEKIMKKMEYQVRYDALTDIFNRQSFESQIKKNMDKEKPFALFFIDLDDFKKINDTYGHHVGDIILQKVADKLKRIAGEKHFVARLGGDEFVMIKYDPDSALEHISEAVSQAISDTYTVEKLKLNIKASIGISLYPKDTTDMIELNRYADIAMYEAKKNNKIKYKFYHTLSEGKSNLFA